MDVKLYEGKSLDQFAIGDTLGHVTEIMRSILPATIPHNLLYEQNAPILHDIYIEATCVGGQQYFIEIDPYLQIVRAVNYIVQMNQNSDWKISGSHSISKTEPKTVKSILSVFGESVKVFTAAHGEILKLLYDGVCFVFSVEDPQSKMDSLKVIKNLNTQLTSIRLIPTEHSPHFKCLINRELSIKPNIDLSLYNLVQVRLILEEKFNRVMGISLTFPAAEKTASEHEEFEDTSSVSPKRIYFGQSCQCVLQTLGSPDSVYYQERPTTKLLLSGEYSQKHVCQQFVYNYLCLGVDIVFDVGTKQVKKFIFHTNLPNHVEFNIYGRCFFKFGVTENGYAKEGKCFLIHPGVDWKEVENFFTGSQVLKFLSKLQRNESTNALCPFPLSSLWLLFNQLLFEITPSNNIATVYVCSVSGDEHLALQGRDRGVLVETNFQEETTEKIIEDQILSDGQTHSSDVTPSMPEDDSKQLSYQVEPRPDSAELSSMEPLEESDTFFSFTGQNNSTQDDQRGKTPEENPKRPLLPYPYPFQAYHPTKHNEVYYSSSNAVMTWSQQATDCGKDMQFIHIEMATEEENTLCTEAVPNHILLQSHLWRVNVHTREEQEAMDAAAIAAREEELRLAQRQDGEGFMYDTTSNPSALNVEYNSITSEFEEISYPTSDISPTIDESTSDHNHNEPEEKYLETELTGTQESVVIKDEVVSGDPPPESSMLEGDSVDNGNSEKGTESQLVYKPQPSRTAASRTRGIIKTVTQPPKANLENPSRKKKPNSELAKNLDGKLSSPPNQTHSKTSPKTTAKFSKSSTATKVDQRKVHFYTDKKSKAIASSFKPKEKVEVVKRAHKDGTGYPHHHFKSSQLSALLQHCDTTSDDSVQSQRPGTNLPNTFNRIFADESGQEVKKPLPIVRKLNTPFATEHNSTVFTDQSDSPSQAESPSQGELPDETETSHSPVDDQVNSVTDKPDHSDQTRSLDGKNVDQEDQGGKDDRQASDQTGDQDSETGDYHDQNGDQNSQTKHQNSQTSDQDCQTGDLTSKDGYYGTHTGEQEGIEILDQHHLTCNDENNEGHKSPSKEQSLSNVIAMTETPTADETRMQETITLSTDLTSPTNDNQPPLVDTTSPNNSTLEDDKVHICSLAPLTVDVTLEHSDNDPNLLESPQTDDNKPNGLQSSGGVDIIQREFLTTMGNTLPNKNTTMHNDAPISSEDVPSEDSSEEDGLLGHHSLDDSEAQQLVSPRKQWSISQPLSCPDSLNQVHRFVLYVFSFYLYNLLIHDFTNVYP